MKTHGDGLDFARELSRDEGLERTYEMMDSMPANDRRHDVLMLALQIGFKIILPQQLQASELQALGIDWPVSAADETSLRLVLFRCAEIVAKSVRFVGVSRK